MLLYDDYYRPPAAHVMQSAPILGACSRIVVFFLIIAQSVVLLRGCCDSIKDAYNAIFCCTACVSRAVGRPKSLKEQLRVAFDGLHKSIYSENRRCNAKSCEGKRVLQERMY